MANELCAFGFSEDWDGNYTLVTKDIWVNANNLYWLYRDAWYWYISSSPHFYEETYRRARKAFTIDDPSPAGTYIGLDGYSNGIVRLGIC